MLRYFGWEKTNSVFSRASKKITLQLWVIQYFNPSPNIPCSPQIKLRQLRVNRTWHVRRRQMPRNGSRCSSTTLHEYRPEQTLMQKHARASKIAHIFQTRDERRVRGRREGKRRENRVFPFSSLTSIKLSLRGPWRAQQCSGNGQRIRRWRSLRWLADSINGRPGSTAAGSPRLNLG